MELLVSLLFLSYFRSTNSSLLTRFLPPDFPRGGNWTCLSPQLPLLLLPEFCTATVSLQAPAPGVLRSLLLDSLLRHFQSILSSISSAASHHPPPNTSRLFPLGCLFPFATVSSVQSVGAQRSLPKGFAHCGGKVLL